MCVFVYVCVCVCVCAVSSCGKVGRGGQRGSDDIEVPFIGNSVFFFSFFFFFFMCPPCERATCVASVALGAPLAPPQCRLWVICVQLCGLTVPGRR